MSLAIVFDSDYVCCLVVKFENREITRLGPMLLVTLHGGKPDKNPHKNNVHAYDKDGKKLSSTILDHTEGVLTDELRGIHAVGKYLYVVNANKLQNSILCYEGAGTHYRFVGWFASRHTCAAILHPFDLAFDGLGYSYLSSQDTNVVTRFIVSDEGRIARPAPIAAALPPNGKFLAGTFVASSNGKLSDPPTTPVPTPVGLEYSDADVKKHSVRGIAWANGRLYVADQPASTIKMYDITGKYLGQSNQVETPVHVVVYRGNLYVSGGDQVVTAQLPNSPGDFVLRTLKGVKVKNASGMAFGNSGILYVASRTENRIAKFDANFNPLPFRCELPDNPEFLLHV
ncbi:MAG TPA: hypothetical protein VM715_03490 [Candidatus Acidoferrum sp.]|nr:hypothetical protein [Candidatus Acidoferrum sp.]